MDGLRLLNYKSTNCQLFFSTRRKNKMKDINFYKSKKIGGVLQSFKNWCLCVNVEALKKIKEEEDWQEEAEATKASDTDSNIKDFKSKPNFQNNSSVSRNTSSDAMEQSTVLDKDADDSSTSKGDKTSKSSSEILLNPNVFTEFKLGCSEEEIAADESSVMKASLYSKYVEDLCNLDVNPMDGETLTNTLHSHGINIRYQGKVGISIAAREYDLDTALPFQISDILNLLPDKHSTYGCSFARDLFEDGRAQLSKGMLIEACILFSQAFSILQLVTGRRKDVANCCRYLAMVLNHSGNLAGAIMQQHRELSCGNMFHHGLSQTVLALHHMSWTVLLLSLSSGLDHPDVAATFINIAMVYQDLEYFFTTLQFVKETFKKKERLLGADHIQTAVCHHAIAIAFNSIGEYKISHQEQLGERQQHIQPLEMKLVEMDRELRGVKLDNEAACAKDDLLREQNKELTAFRRELDNLEAERAQRLQQMYDLQEHIQEKERQILRLEEQLDNERAHPDLIKASQAAKATNIGSRERALTGAQKIAAAGSLFCRNYSASYDSTNDKVPAGLRSGLASLDSKAVNFFTVVNFLLPFALVLGSMVFWFM